MARGTWWECPICHAPNPPEMATCVNTAQHDAGTETRYRQAISGAAQVLADARADMAAKPARQVAQEAWLPGGPSVDELEAKVRDLRARARQKAAA